MTEDQLKQHIFLLEAALGEYVAMYGLSPKAREALLWGREISGDASEDPAQLGLR